MMLVLTLALLLLPLQSPATPPTLAGAWEGSSLCTVPNSPCHDEHVIYHIRAAEDKDPKKFTIDANKIVNGAEESMGPLECTFTAEKSELYCDTAGNWRFTVRLDTMVGTLTLKNGTLYRKVSLKRK